MYSDIYNLIVNKKCKKIFISKEENAEKDNNIKDETMVELSQRDAIRLRPIILSKIELVHFNCKNKESRVEEFESLQLCLILAASDSEFEKYFLFIENKLSAFRFKYRICISQSSLDHYLNANAEYYNSIETIPFAMLNSDCENPILDPYAKKMSNTVFFSVQQSNMLKEICDRIFGAELLPEILIKHYENDLKSGHLACLVYNELCLELDFIQFSFEDKQSDFSTLFKKIQRKLGSYQCYYEKQLATKYYIVNFEDCEQMLNRKTNTSILSNNLIKNRKHFEYEFNNDFNMPLPTTTNTSQKQSTSSSSASPNGSDEKKTKRSFDDVNKRENDENNDSSSSLPIILDMKNTNEINLPLLGKFLLHYKDMARYLKYKNLQFMKKRINAIKKENKLYYSNLWLIQQRLTNALNKKISEMTNTADEQNADHIDEKQRQENIAKFNEMSKKSIELFTGHIREYFKPNKHYIHTDKTIDEVKTIANRIYLDFCKKITNSQFQSWFLPTLDFFHNW